MLIPTTTLNEPQNCARICTSWFVLQRFNAINTRLCRVTNTTTTTTKGARLGTVVVVTV